MTILLVISIHVRQLLKCLVRGLCCLYPFGAYSVNYCRALWERARNEEQELMATIARMRQEHNAEVDQLNENIGKVMK